MSVLPIDLNLNIWFFERSSTAIPTERPATIANKARIIDRPASSAKQGKAFSIDSVLSQEDFSANSFVLKHYYDLQFSPAVETIVKKDKKNPKRVLRDVKKQLQNNGIGTKSQQALKLQHELKKEEYKSNSKHKKQMDAEQKFKLKQQKKKAKHRGH